MRKSDRAIIAAGPLTANGKAAALTAANSKNDFTAEDRKLLQYVRLKAPLIVAGLTRASAEAGAGRDWGGMNEFLGVATQFSTLAGTTATVPISGALDAVAGRGT